MSLHHLLDFVLHIDKHLGHVIRQNGQASYLILAGVIFAETGLVVTPFLPGDSLLFAVGIFCHPDQGGLQPLVAFAVFMVAAFLGDTCNYFIGKFFGQELFRNENSRIFKKSHLAQTHEFFEKHGKKTIILARFVPIVRTFAPFVAGLGKMPYGRFIGYSICGTGLWVAIFLFGGYFIGQIKAVQDHFFIAVIVMVLVTGAPLVWEVWKGIRESRLNKAESPSPAPLP
jgi:membrane-associated protein